MGDLWDKIRAKGYGAADAATAGNVDDVYPKLLDAIPARDDGTGIPREYASGSAENDYRNEYKADRADLAQRYPKNFGDGGLMMNAAQAVPAMALGPAAAVGAGVAHGAASGWGNSENTGSARVKDAVRGGAEAGALGAGANVVAAAAPAAKAAFDKLRTPPQGPMVPAMATAAPAPMPAPAPRPMGGMQINMAEGGVPARTAALPPPRPTSVDLREVMAPNSSSALAQEEASSKSMLAGTGRNSWTPPDPMKIPRPAKVPEYHGMPEADAEILEQRLRQTEANGAKKIEARMQDRNNPQPKTVRPGKKARAQ